MEDKLLVGIIMFIFMVVTNLTPLKKCNQLRVKGKVSITLSLGTG